MGGGVSHLVSVYNTFRVQHRKVLSQAVVMPAFNPSA